MTPFKRSLPGVYAAFMVSVMLAAIIPLMALVMIPMHGKTVAVFISFAVCAYAGIGLGACIYSQRPEWTRLTYYLFIYVWMGLAPLCQAIADVYPIRGNTYSVESVARAGWALFLGFAAYEITQWYARKQNYQASSESTFFELPKMLWVNIFGLFCTVVLIQYLGGPRLFLLSRSDMSELVDYEFGGTDSSVRQAISHSVRVIPFIILYCNLWLLRHRRSWSSSVFFNVLLLGSIAALVLVNLLVSNIVNSPRYWIGTIVVSMVFMFVKHWTLRVKFMFVTVMFFLLAVLFPYSDLFRRTNDLSEVSFIEGLPFLETTDYDNYQQLIHAGEYAEANGFQYGRQTIGAVFSVIPRRIWADKPIPSGRLVAESRGQRYTNLSMSIWGEGYLDGGYLGVIFLLSIFGWATGRLEAAIANGVHQGNALSIFGPIFAAYQIFFLRGAMMNTLTYLLPSIVFFAVVWYYQKWVR